MSSSTLTTSEAFVHELCRRSVLSPWCYNNPRGKNGKELCDVLVVCDPHIIILSVKEVALKDTGEPEVNFQRWEREAVKASRKQIHGAARWLASAPQVIRNDGSPGLKLPAPRDRRLHRIAVAFGGREEVPIVSADDDKGFVHVMNEGTFQEVLTELDTITDLVDYLTAVETCVRSCPVIITGSGADLLGYYLFNARSFPTRHDMMVIQEGIWTEVQSKPEFVRRKEADRDSFTWDKLIESLAGPASKAVGKAGVELSDFEIAFRAMSRETRFSRRHLGAGLREFLLHATSGKLRGRILEGLGGVLYVIVYFRAGENDECRANELKARCFIARHKIGRGDTIIGIGIGEYAAGRGSTADTVYMSLPAWSEADAAVAEKLMAETGFFRASRSESWHAEEFPPE